MEKYNSAEALLKAGANPDIISSYSGTTALYLAAGFSWIDNHAKKDPKFIKLLLEYGADPNIIIHHFLQVFPKKMVCAFAGLLHVGLLPPFFVQFLCE